jgi:thiol-disulfide isomerase/thioredoxin
MLGHPVLINFFSSDCINCRRVDPLINRIFSHYQPFGLRYIGVFVPEYDFERNSTGFQAGIDKFKVMTPTIFDEEMKIWEAYGGSYWPRQALVDVEGNICFEQVGEGNYIAIEQAVRKQLIALGQPIDTVEPLHFADTEPQEISPEMHYGQQNMDKLGNGPVCTPDGCDEYLDEDDEGSLLRDKLMLSGQWVVKQESLVNTDTTNQKQKPAMRMKFRANAVHSVMESCSVDGKPARLSIYCGDVYRQVEVSSAGMYRFFESDGQSDHDRIICVEIEQGAVRVLSFVFE